MAVLHSNEALCFLPGYQWPLKVTLADPEFSLAGQSSPEKRLVKIQTDFRDYVAERQKLSKDFLDGIDNQLLVPAACVLPAVSYYICHNLPDTMVRRPMLFGKIYSKIDVVGISDLDEVFWALPSFGRVELLPCILYGTGEKTNTSAAQAFVCPIEDVAIDSLPYKTLKWKKVHGWGKVFKVPLHEIFRKEDIDIIKMEMATRLEFDKQEKNKKYLELFYSSKQKKLEGESNSSFLQKSATYLRKVFIRTVQTTMTEANQKSGLCILPGHPTPYNVLLLRENVTCQGNVKSRLVKIQYGSTVAAEQQSLPQDTLRKFGNKITIPQACILFPMSDNMSTRQPKTVVKIFGISHEEIVIPDFNGSDIVVWAVAAFGRVQLITCKVHSVGRDATSRKSYAYLYPLMQNSLCRNAFPYSNYLCENDDEHGEVFRVPLNHVYPYKDILAVRKKIQKLEYEKHYVWDGESYGSSSYIELFYTNRESGKRNSNSSQPDISTWEIVGANGHQVNGINGANDNEKNRDGAAVNDDTLLHTDKIPTAKSTNRRKRNSVENRIGEDAYKQIEQQRIFKTTVIYGNCFSRQEQVKDRTVSGVNTGDVIVVNTLENEIILGTVTHICEIPLLADLDKIFIGAKFETSIHFPLFEIRHVWGTDEECKHYCRDGRRVIFPSKLLLDRDSPLRGMLRVLRDVEKRTTSSVKLEATENARKGVDNTPATKLPLQIRTMEGKTFKIVASTDWTVERLKQEFEKWHHGNTSLCLLYYKAKRLQDKNSLQSYKIGAGDVLQANYKSVGGHSRNLVDFIFTQMHLQLQHSLASSRSNIDYLVMQMCN